MVLEVFLHVFTCCIVPWFTELSVKTDYIFISMSHEFKSRNENGCHKETTHIASSLFSLDEFYLLIPDLWAKLCFY